MGLREMGGDGQRGEGRGGEGKERRDGMRGDVGGEVKRRHYVALVCTHRSSNQVELTTPIVPTNLALAEAHHDVVECWALIANVKDAALLDTPT